MLNYPFRVILGPSFHVLISQVNFIWIAKYHKSLLASRGFPRAEVMSQLIDAILIID